MSAENARSRGPFTVKEAAEELGISEELTRGHIKRGELRAYRYGDRKTLIYQKDLEEFRERAGGSSHWMKET